MSMSTSTTKTGEEDGLSLPKRRNQLLWVECLASQSKVGILLLHGRSVESMTMGHMPGVPSSDSPSFATIIHEKEGVGRGGGKR